MTCWTAGIIPAEVFEYPTDAAKFLATLSALEVAAELLSSQ